VSDSPELLELEASYGPASKPPPAHWHPSHDERFTVLEGELTLKRAGQTTILHEDESAVIEAGVWHDWWNAIRCRSRCRKFAA
jgi:quercetin dioxygenase-like cupin family protein